MFREDIDYKSQKRIFCSNLVHFLDCFTDLYGLADITLGDRSFPALGIDVWGIFFDANHPHHSNVKNLQRPFQFD